MSVYTLCVGACVWMCVWYMCGVALSMHMWRPEVDVRCLLSLCALSVIESLMEPEARLFHWLTCH